MSASVEVSEERVEEVNWITPLKNQGQIVMVSYGTDESGAAYKRVLDLSDRSTSYYHLGAAEETWDPANGCIDVVEECSACGTEIHVDQRVNGWPVEGVCATCAAEKLGRRGTCERCDEPLEAYSVIRYGTVHCDKCKSVVRYSLDESEVGDSDEEPKETT